MECDCCPFEHEFQDECPFFGDLPPKDFIADDGCNLQFYEAKILDMLNEHQIGLYYEHMGTWMMLNDKKNTMSELFEKECKQRLLELQDEMPKATRQYQKYRVLLESRRKKNK